MNNKDYTKEEIEKLSECDYCRYLVCPWNHAGDKFLGNHKEWLRFADILGFTTANHWFHKVRVALRRGRKLGRENNANPRTHSFSRRKN